MPALPGLEDFEGVTFHTARWNHDHDLTGRNVVVVGTGASAIQTVPRIQPIAKRVTVFQRTPPWVVPHRDRPITEFERRLYRRLPALQRLVRSTVYLSRELLVPGLAYRPQLMNAVQKMAEAHLAKQVPDPALRAKLTPDYVIGCKRILPSNQWYPAVTQPNVEIVPSAVTEVRRSGVVGADGVLHEADTLILATGFHVTDTPFAEFIRGRDGVRLDDMWHGSPQAYRGAAVPGFPNLFWVIGPNTGLGHNSMVFMIEAQLTYLVARARVDGAPRRRPDRGAPRRLRGLQPRPADEAGGDRVEHRRLLELVPRRQRSQRDDLAGLHVALLAADAPVRRARICVRERDRTGSMAPRTPRRRAPNHAESLDPVS